MEGSTFSEHLALLPKINTEERTLLYVQGQKSFINVYALEGRNYMLSWQDDDGLSHSEEKRIADIDLGTPILKPRVKNLAKPTILTKSPKIDEGNKKTRTVKAVISIKSSNSDKDCHQQRAAIGKKNGNATNKVDKRSRARSQKKRINESPSDSSSRRERLKERREKKRAKKAAVEAPKSDKENDVEETHETRKRSGKMPAGFALMHGFAATNVGKGRLTVKPPAIIGVFNKGRASRRAVTAKSKGPRKNNRWEDCFSESKFLNKSKSEDVSPGQSFSGSSGASNSSHGMAARGRSTREKVTKNIGDPSEVKSTAPTKEPKSPSVIRDVKHGNTNTCFMSVTSYKQGSVVVDATRHAWASVMYKSDAEKKDTAVVSQKRCETPLSISPSQSASQHPEKLEGNGSKYFEDCSQSKAKAQNVTKEPLVSLCSLEDDDVARMSMTEDQVENVGIEDNKVSDAMQRELGFDERMPTDVTHDSDSAQRELEHDEHMPINLHSLQTDVLDEDIKRCAYHLRSTEFGDMEDIVFDEHDEILGQNGSSDVFFINEIYDVAEDDLHGFTTPCHDHHISHNGRGDSQEEEFHRGIPSEDAIVIDCDGCSIDADSSQEPNALQVDRFYQGRAMLLGCTVQENGYQRSTAPSYLASAEVDVAKRLRDHWHPRRL